MHVTYQKISKAWKRRRLLRHCDPERVGCMLSELQASQDQLKLAMDVGRMATWDYDVQADVFKRSIVHDQLYGFFYSLHHWNFKKFISLVVEEDRSFVEEQFLKAFEGKASTFHVEYRILRPDKKLQWLELRAQCLDYFRGKPRLLRGAVVDVTRLKQIEIEQKEEIVQRDEFLGIASHELRNPLQTLDFHLNLLKTDLEGSGKNKSSLASVKACLRQASTLKRLVRDFLDVSRITHGQLRVECLEFQAEPFIKSIVKDLEVQGVEIDLKVEPNTKVWGDPVRLEQVLMNLLMNAVRHGESKPIQISIRQMKTGVRFLVQDHGCGISVQDQRALFGRFERRSKSASDGMGLGLYISKHIVEAHGGKIWFESEESVGSTFYFEIPHCDSIKDLK